MGQGEVGCRGLHIATGAEDLSSQLRGVSADVGTMDSGGDSGVWPAAIIIGARADIDRCQAAKGEGGGRRRRAAEGVHADGRDGHNGEE